MVKTRFTSIILVTPCCAFLAASFGAAWAGGGRAAYSGNVAAVRASNIKTTVVRDHRGEAPGSRLAPPQPSRPPSKQGNTCAGGGYAYGPTGWYKTYCRP
jgi:hypothetical protein